MVTIAEDLGSTLLGKTGTGLDECRGTIRGMLDATTAHLICHLGSTSEVLLTHARLDPEAIAAYHPYFHKVGQALGPAVDPHRLRRAGSVQFSDHQALHALELRRVVRHQGEAQRSRMRCDEQVLGADHRTAPFQLGANLRVVDRRSGQGVEDQIEPAEPR